MSNRGSNGGDSPILGVMQTTEDTTSYHNGKVMVAAVVTLSVVVILVALLHLYARYVMRRQARRRAATRELGLPDIIQWQASAEPSKIGVDPLVLAALPMYAYRRVGGESDRESRMAAECIVCLSLLEEGEIMRILPNCRHVFHTECIDRWLWSHTICPVCRTEVEPRPQPEPEETAHDAESMTAPPPEGTSEEGIHPYRISGSSSRLSSFRRMLGRERSSKRVTSCGQPDDAAEDFERP
ncbi:hypothetical protein MLD38_033320 [Melastoma candidum]|uniref:Uncharacterized protein n=1 Tax=Melastoma candidum TaxID=119954 RepID=A0ACB9M6X9_9MYRT|nr:hypothetical protein MLD38_033320 [Melastoma candidum]